MAIFDLSQNMERGEIKDARTVIFKLKHVVMLEIKISRIGFQ